MRLFACIGLLVLLSATPSVCYCKRAGHACFLPLPPPAPWERSRTHADTDSPLVLA
jgi:hypothetical protein